MNNFKLIFRILKYIETCMEYEEFDDDNFTASHFGVRISVSVKPCS